MFQTKQSTTIILYSGYTEYNMTSCDMNTHLIHKHGMAKHAKILAVPFHNTQTLKFKAQARNVFFATVNQMFSSSSQLSATARHCFRYLNCAQQFDYGPLGSCQKLGGAVEYLIDDSEKLVCRSSFEF